MIMAVECMTNEWGRCCCTCMYRLDDHSHPCTDGGSILHRRACRSCYAEVVEKRQRNPLAEYWKRA